MAYKNYRQYQAIKSKNEIELRKLFPDIKEQSGIYLYYRKDENGIVFFYCGQSVNIWQRILSHHMGYSQHIDLSLKNRKYMTKENPYGWNIVVLAYCKESELDKLEQYYILDNMKKGFQCYNSTYGSQGKGKVGISENKQPKGYRDGIKQGEKNAQKFVANLFEKHLNYVAKKEPPTKLQENAMKKFEEFLQTEE